MVNHRMLHIYNWLLSPIPGFRIMKLKLAFLRMAGVKIGTNVALHSRVYIWGCGQIDIGDDVTLKSGASIESNSCVLIGNRVEVNAGALLSANGTARLVVEDDVRIAHFVSLKCSTHEISFNETGSIAGDSRFLDIRIGEGSWLCAGSIVLPGVTVGKRNVVAAGAVVIKDTPDGVLMGGVPAVEKKRYGMEETV